MAPVQQGRMSPFCELSQKIFFYSKDDLLKTTSSLEQGYINNYYGIKVVV